MALKKSKHGYLRGYGDEFAVHGRLYNIWSDMRKRCNTVGSTNYYKYGAKGIAVCDEWNTSYEAFLIWSLKNNYKSGLEIDRIKNNLGYSPENCRWVTELVQARNKTNSRVYILGSFSGNLKQWAEKTGIKRSTLSMRIYAYKWPIDLALTKGSV